VKAKKENDQHYFLAQLLDQTKKLHAMLDPTPQQPPQTSDQIK
jgi:hypothetical protein